MEYRNINLTIEEIVLIVDALEMVYLRKIKKVQLMTEPRSVKVNEELRFCQVLMQRLMAIANYDNEEKAISIIGCNEPGGNEAKTTAGA